ncbi:hypothetical protein Prudu_010846 [Prunus dulcis]|uniref:Uncharacterized protein n=1 Tax=Prunus dulcis TaxID=3755 RepID=A0A4Y1R9F8_PRUDU|nr:hypothetical protein Prudu_010846 [Prunus dulcis]
MHAPGVRQIYRRDPREAQLARASKTAGAAYEHQWLRDRWSWNHHRVPYVFRPTSTLGLPGADRKVMISDGCSPEFHRSSSSIFSFAPKVRSTRNRDLRRAVEVRGIHHRAIHSFRASKSGENFWDWSKYRGDFAEISAEV